MTTTDGTAHAFEMPYPRRDIASRQSSPVFPSAAETTSNNVHFMDKRVKEMKYASMGN